MNNGVSDHNHKGQITGFLEITKVYEFTQKALCMPYFYIRKPSCLFACTHENQVR